MPMPSRPNVTALTSVTILIGSRRSIGLTAFWTTLPIGALAALTSASGATSSGRTFLAYLGIIVLAQAALGVVLLVCRFALAATNPARRSVRTATILVTVLAGVVRGIVLVTLLPWAGLADTASPTNRILSSAVTFAIWLTLCGVALEANDQYRQELRTLLEQLVTKELQQRLLDEGRQVDYASNRGDSGYRRTARMLQDALEERLRLINHDMWFAATPAVSVSQNRWGLIRTVFTTPVPKRSLMVVYAIIVTLGSCLRMGFGTGLILGLLFSVTTAVILKFTSGGWLYVLLLIAPAGIASLFEGVKHLDTSGAAVEPSIVVIGLLTPLLVFIGTAARATIDDRRAVLTELSARIDAVPWDGLDD